MKEENKKEVSQEDIENVLRILENFSATETDRMNLQVSASKPKGNVDKKYHHGRCDVGSPWAKGECFDVFESQGE